MHLVISLGEFMTVIFCVIVSQCKSYLKQTPQVINIICFSIILKSIKRSLQIIKNRNSIKIARHSCSNSKLWRYPVKNSNSISICYSLVKCAKDGKRININNRITTFKFRNANSNSVIHRIYFLNKNLSISFERKKLSSKLCVKIYPIVLHLIKYLLMHYPNFELPSGSNPQDSNISLTSYMLFSAHELNTHL